jgi:S1-C subfamily serine protease
VVAVGLVAGLTAMATPTIPATADFLPAAPAELAHRLRQVTFRVVGIGCSVESNMGTAVALGDGTLLTNRHVADRARLLNVVPDLGPTLTATASVASPVDLAILHAGGAVASAATATRLELAARDPSPGRTVTVAGYADSYDLRVLTTRVIDVVDGASRGQRGPVLRLATRLRKGMSGSPVLDEAGHLAGLVFAVQGNYTLAIPASSIRTFSIPTAIAPAASC